MILQNKQTGVLGVLEATTYHGGRPDNIIEVYEMGMGGAVRVLAQYNTLEELLEEWKDYKPKEPLIKDEKIRKAVRAFGEVIQEKKHILVIKLYERGIAEFSNGSCFWMRLPVSNETMNALEDRTYYTITELCGEEEAPEPLEPTFIDLDERIKEKEEG